MLLLAESSQQGLHRVKMLLDKFLREKKKTNSECFLSTEVLFPEFCSGDLAGWKFVRVILGFR